MKKFQYKAWDENFEMVKEVIEEQDINSAKEIIKSKGYSLIDISEKKGMEDIAIFKRKLKDSELSEFCGQMAIILDAGVNILKGLEVLEEQMENKKMKEIIGTVHEGVRRGRTLGKSMEDSGYFPNLLCDMVNSGELSGDMDTILFNMEGFYEREAAIKSKIVTASIYPIMLLAVAFGMVVFFNFFIFKELEDLFTDSDNLPFITKALIGFMNFFNSNIVYIVIAIFLIVIFIKYLKTLDKVKYFSDKTALKIPVISKVRLYLITSRFTRSMSIFIKSSVPILNSLDSIKMIVDNHYIAKKIENIKIEIINGSSIAEGFESQKFFDPLVIQMIRVGEESGKLEETLMKLAEIYDKKTENSIGKLMAMIEPAFTIVIGVFVAIIILAIAMPVMNMSNSLG
ncbi:MAG: type II secretion system F family protein [Clostridiaceae bacterium]